MARVAFVPNQVVNGTLILSRAGLNDVLTVIWNCQCPCGNLFKSTTTKLRKNKHGSRCPDCMLKKRQEIASNMRRYIVHEFKEELDCKECGHHGPREDFPLIGANDSRRNVCKPCWSKQGSRSGRIKRAKQNPENFLSCGDCGEVFSTYVSGRPRIGGKRTLVTDCPFCGSDELERFEAW